MLKAKDLENDEVDFGTEKDETESMLVPREQNSEEYDFGLSDESSVESEDEGMDDDDDDYDMDNKSGDYDDDDYDDDAERKNIQSNHIKYVIFAKTFCNFFKLLSSC